ncbi:mechanosensitive ion channel family protein [Desulfopila sp. IMCC35008]|uniref:mechanosensitive ion channel family protein n=1 Tax=Desulfopila sp. IMCC35008 TaxID=2653858 RepID=UPI0013D860C9|nr:mechanosensitive ion channel family protein [Desulfopila sp. IMCC35008]
MLENTVLILLHFYESFPTTTIFIISLTLGCVLINQVSHLHPIKQSLPLLFVITKSICILLVFIIFHTIFFHLLTTNYWIDRDIWPFTCFTFIFFLVIGVQLANVIYAFALKKYMSSPEETTSTVSGLLRGVIYGTSIFLALGAFFWQQGYSFTGVWISTGLATALVGIALQQTLGDLFSGIALGVEGAFHIGDWIQLKDDGTEGTVIDINWRATWLQDWDNTRHIIPNSKLAKQGFTNCGNEFQHYQPWYIIKLPAELDPRFAKQLLLEGIYRCKHVLKHPTPVVRLTDASTVPYTYICWVAFPNYPAMFRGREELYREIHYVLQQAGISPAAVTSEWRIRKSVIPVAEPPTIQLALKSQPIFSHLADEEIEQLAMLSQQKHYDTKSVIQYEDGEIDALDVLISGVVEVSTKLANGKKVVIGELGPGDSYGLVSMFTDQPIPTHWIAETDVTLIRIDFGIMKEIMQKYPEVADRIAVEVKQRQDEAEYLRIQNSAEPPQSSLREIKKYIRQIIKR